jgi:hypothetical protein
MRQLQRYGVTLDQLTDAQGGVCAICRTAEPREIDHDHETGRVRGALCQRCNAGLHWVERPGWLDRAREYLDAQGD